MCVGHDAIPDPVPEGVLVMPPLGRRASDPAVTLIIFSCNSLILSRLVFGTGAAAWVAFVVIGFYLTQLSGFKGEKQWKREYPNIIPLATACGVIGFFL